MQLNTVFISWNLENIYHTVTETSVPTLQKSQPKYKKNKNKANFSAKSQTNSKNIKNIAKGPSHYGEIAWVNKKTPLINRPKYHKKF